jgi:hypothetical protein
MLRRGVSYPTIALFLKEKGIKLSTQSISRHNKNHVKKNEKPKQVQKKGLIKVKQLANPKKREPQTPNQRLKKDNQIQTQQERFIPQDIHGDKHNLQYEQELKKMTEDVDVINEYLFAMGVAKDRLKRGLDEEADSGLVLATTGNAIKDYTGMLKNFNEITAGMESLQKLRFAQLAQMIGNLFIQTPLTDKTRAELLAVVTKISPSVEPVRVVEDAQEVVVTTEGSELTNDNDDDVELDLD